MSEATQTAAVDNSSLALNKGKKYQIALFPFNNAATNCYLALMSFIAYYGGYYLFGGFVGAIITSAAMAALTIALSTVIMLMRIFDGITDPIVGAMMDKTNGRLGKFRPYMIIGNITLAVSVLVMFFAIRPVSVEWLRWMLFIIAYIVYVLGYTCQCACTKAGQNCITNDPHQRSQFIVWNMIGMIGSIVLVNLIGGGLLPMFIEPINAAEKLGAQYNPEFYNILVPIVIVISAIYTVLALIAIWKKDRPDFWGVDAKEPPAKLKDYVKLLKENSQIRWLVVSSGMNKLASTIATSAAVAILLYEIMMTSYNGLFVPIYALSFVFMGVFFFLGARTAGAKGQKRAIVQYTVIALLFYIGLIIMLSIWDPENINAQLSLIRWIEQPDGSEKMVFTTNFYTLMWIVLYGCGYGAYNCCAEMCIPMVADCTDYEMYRSGKYVPGIMGTLFSLIDKLVSSLATVLISAFTIGLIPGLNGTLPSTGIIKELAKEGLTFDYTGVQLSAIICICILPMASWVITLFCMYFYKLTGPKLKEIQAVNAVRKAAIAGGMLKEEALATWVTIDQVPADFIPAPRVRRDKKTGEVLPPPKENILDKLYKKTWGRKEVLPNEPSVNAIQIPEEYAGGKEKIMKAAAEANESMFKKKTDHAGE